MFRVGDLVKGTSTKRVIGIDIRELLLIVTSTEPLKVQVVAGSPFWMYDDKSHKLAEEDVELCSYKRYISMFPHSITVNGYTPETLNQIKYENKNIKEEIKMELRMNKENFGAYILTDEERETLRNDIIALLEEFDPPIAAIITRTIINHNHHLNFFCFPPHFGHTFADFAIISPHTLHFFIPFAGICGAAAFSASAFVEFTSLFSIIIPFL